MCNVELYPGICSRCRQRISEMVPSYTYMMLQNHVARVLSSKGQHLYKTISSRTNFALFTDQPNSKISNIYCREFCNYNVKLQGTVIDISSLLTDRETISSCTISIITVSTRGQINTVAISVWRS